MTDFVSVPASPVPVPVKRGPEERSKERTITGETNAQAGKASRQPVAPPDVREAALTLFAERGYHGTTMNDLAESLGIRAPSLYNHISSKRELLQDVMVETLDGVLGDFETALASSADVFEQLREAVRVYVLRHTRRRREALIVNREARHLEEPLRSQVRDRQARHARGMRNLIQRGIGAGSFSTPSATLAAFAILEMGVSVARWFREDGALSAEQVAELYAEFAVRLVTTPTRQQTVS